MAEKLQSDIKDQYLQFQFPSDLNLHDWSFCLFDLESEVLITRPTYFPSTISVDQILKSKNFCNTLDILRQPPRAKSIFDSR